MRSIANRYWQIMVMRGKARIDELFINGSTLTQTYSIQKKIIQSNKKASTGLGSPFPRPDSTNWCLTALGENRAGLRSCARFLAPCEEREDVNTQEFGLQMHEKGIAAAPLPARMTQW